MMKNRKALAPPNPFSRIAVLQQQMTECQERIRAIEKTDDQSGHFAEVERFRKLMQEFLNIDDTDD
jgi:hypothetical protein